MYPISTAGPAPAIQSTDITAVPNGAPKVKLIQQALSRARMRRPQAVIPSSEAYRPARQIAMQARRQAAREQGIL
ncbi:hypothetical protein Sya03_03600 [Spirilliplanes yamanashiensis]|uniref:Uncharacterized protein n=1 Tax=Spirilliplanes yamanashiensis TaxID=42233 RepID=A0A8J3Y3I3_9ACTN|nr:hypothetical protein [Spirilliplanes yamanashiensis]GIJ01008.1 hypothetical protein Sya03_03600 [Spirilliplanes yamanashiensis]